MESCSSAIETWLSHPNADSFWDAGYSFARDNDAIAGALQMSLSDDSSSPAVSLLQQPAMPDHSEFKRTRKPGGTCSPSAKIAKRKPRASKRSTTATTYIIADPANFRQMVQQVTGVQGLGSVSEQQQQQQQAGPGLLQELGSYMPTLDTSAFLFEQATDGPGGLLGSSVPMGQTFDFGPLSSFPTLESWGAM